MVTGHRDGFGLQSQANPRFREDAPCGEVGRGCFFFGNWTPTPETVFFPPGFKLKGHKKWQPSSKDRPMGLSFVLGPPQKWMNPFSSWFLFNPPPPQTKKGITKPCGTDMSGVYLVPIKQRGLIQPPFFTFQEFHIQIGPQVAIPLQGIGWNSTLARGWAPGPPVRGVGNWL